MRKQYKPWARRTWITSKGYILVRDPLITCCPYAQHDGRVYEHHLVIWENNIPFNPSREVVHHIDRCKTNNDIHNLRVMTREEHIKMCPEMYPWIPMEEKVDIYETGEIGARVD